VQLISGQSCKTKESARGIIFASKKELIMCLDFISADKTTNDLLLSKTSAKYFLNPPVLFGKLKKISDKN